jgi:hypothetical protein
MTPQEKRLLGCLLALAILASAFVALIVSILSNKERFLVAP